MSCSMEASRSGSGLMVESVDSACVDGAGAVLCDCDPFGGWDCDGCDGCESAMAGSHGIWILIRPLFALFLVSLC